MENKNGGIFTLRYKNDDIVEISRNRPIASNSSIPACSTVLALHSFRFPGYLTRFIQWKKREEYNEGKKNKRRGFASHHPMINRRLRNDERDPAYGGRCVMRATFTSHNKNIMKVEIGKIISLSFSLCTVITYFFYRIIAIVVPSRFTQHLASYNLKVTVRIWYR